MKVRVLFLVLIMLFDMGVLMLWCFVVRVRVCVVCVLLMVIVEDLMKSVFGCVVVSSFV